MATTKVTRRSAVRRSAALKGQPRRRGLVVACSRRNGERHGDRADGTAEAQASGTPWSTGPGMPERVKKALVAAACGVLLTSTALPEDSWAARSGGRVGGRAFRSAPRPRASPRASPRMRSGGSTTFVAPPPMVGGYGYGYGRGFGSFFAPPVFFFNPFGSIFQIFLLFVAVQAVLSFGENFRTQRGFKEDEDDDEDIFD
ncbi:hypothetical protein HOP50_05g36360 [Chloropicon primus]|uniref:Uncharacterized protein n=1 Tax=Chloropicon primus TaxID=1764295 RepID=A0A5B8MKF1_9CHLO|nr:hypothetical protein A3770_05p36260 [Chloropicon primus]UPR00322.1 hypothetical protein HOP50_05g36360 [Chloropicon primus]|eukprot:QDZ21108.1 hypothetical protein A3770_05p36260 [Chloropicon primus]